MRISVIVSNFNGAQYLPRLLSSLAEQRGVDLELIVVDRNSTDVSKSILVEHANVFVLQEAPESGLVSGYAVGAESATSELLFFCNEDMWFDPNCLRLLAEQIDLDRRIAAADPWQWTYDGKTWIHGGTRFRPATLRNRATYPLRRYEFTVPVACGDLVPFACAGAFLIHRRVYEEAGGWDRSFFLDSEDLDLFLRTWQRGWVCVSVPDAKVFHAGSVSNMKLLPSAGVLVSKKRYISNRSSAAIIGVKYFGAWALLLCLLSWCELTLRHAFALRWRQTGWDFLAAAMFLDRLGPAMRFRRLNSPLRRKLPGEALFTAAEYQGR
jgi:GT2 family glycosyltransferase